VEAVSSDVREAPTATLPVVGDEVTFVGDEATTVVVLEAMHLLLPNRSSENRRERSGGDDEAILFRPKK